MPSLLTMRRFLSALAILGLLVGPLTKPAMAMGEFADANTATIHAETPLDEKAQMGEMPCCPDESPAKSDCVKDCPLMAMCMSKTMQHIALSAGLPLQFAVASVLFPGDERLLYSLFQSPPARPPKI